MTAVIPLLLLSAGPLPASSVRNPKPAIKLESAWAPGAAIPARYTCSGQNASPPLKFSGVPGNAKSLALVMNDPDAPAKVWTHWVLFNIPPATAAIAENSIPAGALAGRNDFGSESYGGPCPPGGAHRYNIRVYALDCMLSLPKDADRTKLDAAMKGHIIAEGELSGVFSRKTHFWQ
ncbi:MAG: YbhB/YbcL family Raf kinase inhibitor-like protein [Elusimicrobiales bacterium]|nr:YbhB/YbcL family Raf kinase inhibitor-like protein [Elusimicrobiales bacterium]